MVHLTLRYGNTSRSLLYRSRFLRWVAGIWQEVTSWITSEDRDFLFDQFNQLVVLMSAVRVSTVYTFYLQTNWAFYVHKINCEEIDSPSVLPSILTPTVEVGGISVGKLIVRCARFTSRCKNCLIKWRLDVTLFASNINAESKFSVAVSLGVISRGRISFLFKISPGFLKSSCRYIIFTYLTEN